MQVTFSKRLHNNDTIRYIDIVISNYGSNNDNRATLILMPAERQYITCKYTSDMDTDVILGIRYIANCHIMLASTCTLDFNNDDSNTYYHFTDSSNTYHNFVDSPIPTEYMQFVSRIMTIMDCYQ